MGLAGSEGQEISGRLVQAAKVEKRREGVKKLSVQAE